MHQLRLQVLICPEADYISDGEDISMDLDSGVVKNHITGERYIAEPLPPFLQLFFERGGLKAYWKAKHAAKTKSAECSLE